ncbi:sensor histidine kinase [Cohnella caldifontis]|uniref:sensor histidine kinase n=1 Tax=Cohnella caldifontis TaxID=3027471 RepID=UPI0023EDF2EE|nr:HAMP domain-containing sensor histidine kinase [Cohnella sp. YIM B05605]
MNKTVRVRKFMLAFLLLTLTVLWLAYVAVHYAATGTWSVASSDGHPGLRIVLPAGLLLVLLAAGYGLRRLIVKPLEALSRSSRQIAEGDWDITLPESRIAEIAQVRDGFESMVESLRGSFSRQAELEEERKFFIGAIAHDLRTPLFALKGYLDGLEQGIAATPEQMKKYAAVCKEKAGQIDRLVEDLFAFSRTEYWEAAPLRDPLDLATVLQQSVESVRRQADEKSVAILLDDGGETHGIRGDAHLLERAMNNLLDNAIRHTPAQGRIYVRCRRDRGGTTVSVRDTGAGFAPSDLPRAFEPLYRGEASRNRSTGGAGLGLAIARRIFRAHDGDLTAGNDPEGGAVLTGRLPAAE